VLPSDPLVDKDGVFEQLMHQNVTVNLRLAQAVAKRMIAHSKNREKDEIIGSIVNLSSIAATRTMPELMAYSVSTAALDQLTRSLAVAFADHGIRVNGIAMGSLMSASLRESLKDNPDLHDTIETCTTLSKPPPPLDISAKRTRRQTQPYSLHQAKRTSSQVKFWR
jgi:7-alpha-hydroxysteroid dehydrogenase